MRMNKFIMIPMLGLVAAIGSVYAGTQTCSDSGGESNCTNTVTNGVGGVGSASESAVADQAAQMAKGATRGGPSPADIANMKAAQKAGQIAACNYIKAQTPIDTQDCQSTARYQAREQKRSCSSNGGSVNWNFSYAGPSFTFSMDLAPKTYGGAAYSSGISIPAPVSACYDIIDSALELTLSKCDTTAQTVKNQVCSNII